MDNTGPYISYGQLLHQLALAGDPNVVKSSISLTNKTSDAGGDIFGYSVVGGDPLPKVGDALCSAVNSKYENIIEILVTPDRVRVETTDGNSLIVNGAAFLLHSDTYDKALVEAEISIQSLFIDQQTRQWFNSRSKTIRIEGKNSNALLLSVPILTVSEIRMNNETSPVNLDYFEIFNNRDGMPDDRRNPRIKVMLLRRNIFNPLQTTTFHRGLMSEIDGTFGFLEEDGSTPALIQKATTRLVVIALKNPVASSIGSGSVGAKKAERVDLHETEYFQPDDTQGGPSGAISGDLEVDRIISMYRGPIGIGGSILDLPTVETVQDSDLDSDGWMT